MKKIIEITCTEQDIDINRSISSETISRQDSLVLWINAEMKLLEKMVLGKESPEKIREWAEKIKTDLDKLIEII